MLFKRLDTIFKLKPTIILVWWRGAKGIVDFCRF